ncbi:MAG: RdgB/HAM1 family non-canonical purine NTP pyrophosphatase [Candidatus Babeliales bacterium]
MNNNKTLVIATHNTAKFAELKNLLTDSGFNLVSLTQLGITHDVDETGTTFQENAILKAKTYASMTGHMVLADDSGLEIDALGGEPGIYSRRYAGDNATDDQKRAFILEKLKGVPAQDRTARFTCVLALADPAGNVHTFDGVREGLIGKQPETPHIPDFPYCSIFVLPEFGKTITQLITMGQSCAKSHRVAAVKKLLSFLAQNQSF